MSRRRLAIALLTLAALSWGFGIVMTKITLEQLRPVDVLGVELVVGAAVVCGVRLVRGGVGATSAWRGFALLGLLEPGLSYALGDFGLDKTGAADAALLVSSETLFAAVLARLVLCERMGRRVVFAIAAGFAGSVVLGLGATGSNSASVVGDVLVLGSSAAAAAYTVAARRIARAGQPDALSVTAVQLVVAAIVCAPLVVAAVAAGQSNLGQADAAHMLAAVATGLLTTAIPFVLFNLAIRDVEVAGGALVLNLVPVIAATLAVVLLGEALGALQLFAGAVIVLAAFGVETEPEPVPVG
jgi:drug/metabolite transporter (DMT)-like permease